MSYRILEEAKAPASVAPVAAPAESLEKPPAVAPAPRLVSLDAYRGFIMILLAASGFGLSSLARQPEDSPLWKLLDRDRYQAVAFHFDHPPWQSNFLPGAVDASVGSPWLRWKVSFWDLIQPAFMFMVGVAMPFSLRRRERLGQTSIGRAGHALIRALVLVLLGVFLASTSSTSTHWLFTNVLAQIGLGYFLLYLLIGRPLWMQGTALAVILVGTWIGIHVYEPPVLGRVDLTREQQSREVLLERAWSAYDPDAVNAKYEKGEVLADPYRQWSKNGNAFHYFDLWFLNLFPRPAEDDPFLFNGGGYQTLNFVPAMGTMLLGLLYGQLMLAAVSTRKRLLLLFGGALACFALGIVAGATCCPIVKRIWTPSWVLFSGGYVIAMLGIFHVLFDLSPLRRLAFPLVVVGMNSIFVYMMGQLCRTWLAQKVVGIHFGWAIRDTLGMCAVRCGWADRLGVSATEAGPLMMELFAPVVTSLSALAVIWLLCYWMYRQRIFIRI